MFGDDIVVQTRLIPPRLPRRWLPRSRLDRLLAAAAEYPVTVVSASAGYGKSSALASFAARGGWPVIWYSLSEGVDDPLVFLLHLVHACRSVAPQAGERTIMLLERHGRGAQAWGQALDALINDLTRGLDDETILVLDDYHMVDDRPDIGALIERLMLHGPPLLHVVLATRRWPRLNCVPTLLARDELLTIGEPELAFTNQEIAELFESSYDHGLSAAEAQSLSEQTGGWAIALQLVWQGARGKATEAGPEVKNQEAGTKSQRFDDLVDSSAAVRTPFPSHEILFRYLAQEALAKQPDDIQAFLLRSSVLTELDPVTCDHVLGGTTSEAWLRTLYRRGLFLTALGDELYRYHPLFHAFLQQRARATLPEWDELHRRAVTYYRAIGAGEKVLYHLIAVGDSDGAALELEQLAQPWLDSGRLVMLLAWIDQLPAPVLIRYPRLLIARGDAARLLARFDTALQAYTEAEQLYAARADAIGLSEALQGQALVYLDTVQPIQAADLLRRAFKQLPRDHRESRAALLRLIAENRLNSGRADQAARLYRAADRLYQTGEPSDVQPRVFLRLGRLTEARALLERQLPLAPAEAHERRPEAHREVTLLLSLICALQGDAVDALRYADMGLDAARRRGAPLSEAIAHIRMGHAQQLGATPDYPAANRHYLQAIALADDLTIQRTKAEAYMGLALLHGFGGDIPAAQAAAREGLTIVERSGDAWMAALLWNVLGAVGVAGGLGEAENWLQEALGRFQISKDTYGQAVVHLWMAVWYHRMGRLDTAGQHALLTLALARSYGYNGLLTRLTLLGPRDRMALVPVLLAGRTSHDLSTFAREWLARGFPAIAGDDVTQTYHPGVTLRIQLFERLRVWRGTEEVDPRAWQRKKAQQLLGLLLTNRHHWLLRDQICDALWADDGQADAETQFKVTLNALNAVLEPARPPRTPPFYIRRQGGAYRFCPSDGVWLDVAEFEGQIAAARTRLAAGADDDLVAAQEALTIAVRLYQGDYLAEYLYEDWAREERERLSARYLEAATRLAELFNQRNQTSEAIRLCETIVARDPCWEAAYQLLMRAYALQGNRRQVLATYERCVRSLRDHLDMAPLPQTTQIYEAVKA